MLRFIGVIRRDVPLSSEKGVAATAEDGRRSHAKRTIPGGNVKKKNVKKRNAVITTTVIIIITITTTKRD